MDKDEIRGEDERRAEARMIACRIRELIAGGVVLDKETGQYRRIQYRDIVILTRSIQGWAESFSAVLGEEGIPAYSVSREGYFETYEVSALLDCLRILDNAQPGSAPRCGADVPVCRSGLHGNGADPSGFPECAVL